MWWECFLPGFHGREGTRVLWSGCFLQVPCQGHDTFGHSRGGWAPVRRTLDKYVRVNSTLLFLDCCCCSVAQSCPTLQPRGLQHARLSCPSLSPGVCSDSCPLSRWCHSNISSSVIPFSSCLQSFPASGVGSSSHQVAKILELQLQHQSFLD